MSLITPSFCMSSLLIRVLYARLAVAYTIAEQGELFALSRRQAGSLMCDVYVRCSGGYHQRQIRTLACLGQYLPCILERPLCLLSVGAGATGEAWSEY